VLALAVLLVGLLVATLADQGVRSTERGLLNTIVTLPPSLRDSLTTVAQLVAVVMPAAIVLVMALRPRFAAVGKLVVAGVAGMLGGLLISHLRLENSHPPTWHELLAGRNGIVAVTIPPVAWLATTTAVVTVAGGDLSRRWRQGLWWLTGIVAVVEVIVGGFQPVDAVVATAVGVSVGSSMLLIFGEPARRPTAAQVVATLQECGVDVAALRQLPRAGESPDMFHATTREGSGLTVRVYANNDRDRDRLVRLTRWLLVRDPQDDRAGTTVESAAEHELLAMVAAARAGGRVPEPVVAYPIAGRQGSQGALVAWIDVGGQPLNLVPPEEVGAATLADLWRSVARLHQHRLAHRLLRTDNITVDGSGRAWLTGLVLAELGATDRQLASDVAELLASLAVRIASIERSPRPWPY
jgi:glycosyltransferase 2 family protein